MMLCVFKFIENKHPWPDPTRTLVKFVLFAFFETKAEAKGAVQISALAPSLGIEFGPLIA